LLSVIPSEFIVVLQPKKRRSLMKQKARILNLVLIISVLVLSFAVGTERSSAVRLPDDFESKSQYNSDNVSSGDVEDHSLVRLSNTPARVGVYKRGGRIKRFYGEAFSFGASPQKSAENFLLNNAYLFGVDPADLDDQHLQPVMYDRNTGQYKFTAIYYSQYQDGIPVFGTRLILLARNEPDYPLVLASVDLRDLGEFQPSKDQSGLDPSRGIASALKAASSLVNFTEPDLVIWAGVEELMDEPTLAYSFIGDNGRPADGSEPEKYLFVTDAETGAILYQENLIIFEDVEGRVEGRATQGRAADYCEEELPEPMPWARVNIGSTIAYADASGDFVIPNSGTSEVTVESRLWGRWFRVYNFGGHGSAAGV